MSAYNEEKNIAKCLRSIALQKKSNFLLEEIIVIDDGSTDKTAARCRNLKIKSLKFVNNKKRMGKSFRLNEIYKMVNSDILIQCDADTVLEHEYVFASLVEKFQSSKKIMMVGGNTKPFPARTFVEEAVNLSVFVYNIMKTSYQDGKNPFTVDGRLLAYRKKLYKSFQIPAEVLANDRFTYFYCLSKKMEYAFCKDAGVFYRSPKSVSDQVKQNSRFLESNERMYRYFERKMIVSETKIPKMLYLKAVFQGFLTNPAACIAIFGVNILTRFRSRISYDTINGKWDLALSTKAA
jgi:glycosyltransferase involved in cell wall biosynthesis